MDNLTRHHVYMEEAIRLAQEGMRTNAGGPFGCVVVRDGEIIGRGCNEVTSSNDPTAHAEVVAIRAACRHLGTFQLDGCDIYTSCEPCPMCLGAIYWARPDRVFYACTRQDAAAIGFDDAFIYTELAVPIADRSIPMIGMGRENALSVFRSWQEKSDKTLY